MLCRTLLHAHESSVAPGCVFGHFSTMGVVSVAQPAGVILGGAVLPVALALPAPLSMLWRIVALTSIVP